MSERTERMMAQVPEYYQQSVIFEGIQAAIAAEYDQIETDDEDLDAQLYIMTATWGLKFWEQGLKIPTILADDYDIRRSRVLSAWRSLASQFSASLIEKVCEAYTNGDVIVSVDIPAGNVVIKFNGATGAPPNINDLKAAIDNIIHAHLGVDYQYKYLTITQVQAMTIAQMNATPLNNFAPFV